MTALELSNAPWLILILLLAWTLRLAHLGSMSIWWDESLSYSRALQDIPTILSNVIPIQGQVTRDLHPPLYFVLLHFAVLALGVSEFALRVLSTFANVLTVALIYPVVQALARAGRLRAPRRVGILSAFFMALSPFYVWYSQEARPYALVLLWSLLAVYALFRMQRTRRSLFSPALLLYFFALAATLATHYLSFLLLPFHAATVLIFERKRGVWLAAFMLAAFAVILLLLPIGAAGLTGSDVGSAHFVPFFIVLRDVVNSFVVGVTANLDEVALLDLALVGLFALGVASTIRPRRRQFHLALFLLAYLFLPALGLQAGSYLRPLYLNSRHLITTSPAFYVGVALGVMALARQPGLRVARAPVAIGAGALFLYAAIFSLNNLYNNPAYAKDDHRGWSEFLRERIRPGDLLVLDAPQAETVYRYYAPEGLEWITLPHLVPDLQEQARLDFETVRLAFRAHPRVWLLELHRPVADPNNHVTDILTRFGTSIDLAYFRGTSTQIALQEIVKGSPVLSGLQSVQRIRRISFGDNLQLLGFDPPKQVAAGQHATIKLYWQLDRPTAENYGVSLRVVDAAGELWGQWDNVPLGNLLPASRWSPGQTVVEVHDLPIDPGALPGKYFVELSAYRSTTHEPLPARGRRLRNTKQPVRLAEVSVARPPAPVDPQRLVLDHHAGTVFADRLNFVGYDADDAPVRPGDPIELTLYFQLLKDPVQAVLSGRVALAQPFPFSLWNSARVTAPFALSLKDRLAGDIIRSRVIVRVPGNADAGQYALQLAIDGAPAPDLLLARDEVQIGTTQVQSLARSTARPDIAHPLDSPALLGDAIEFLGYDLQAPKPLKSGAPVQLTLYWRARKTVDTSYTVFTHLLDTKNQIAGQHDSQPADGARPTTSWAPGEVIADAHSLRVKDDASPGQYQIEIGLYNSADLKRLPVTNGEYASGDRILLEELTLQ